MPVPSSDMTGVTASTQRGSGRRWRARRRAAAVVVLGVVAALVAALGVAGPAAEAAPPPGGQTGPGSASSTGPWVPRPAGRVYTAKPGDNLVVAFQKLRAGDTLELEPGTYPAHVLHPITAKGTATAPITVRAADPARRPLIQGNLWLRGPSYWILDGLRIQTVDQDFDALDISGGTGWTVVNSEIFGASATGAYANVSIQTDTTYGTGAPSDFVFAYNCVHDAGRSTRPDPTDHNIYVNFGGTSTSGGIITRNVIYGHPHGAGIKLGNGGVVGALGPWGVTVSWNTIADGGRQILMHGNLNNDTIYGNLMYDSTQNFAWKPGTTLVYVNLVTGSGNVITHNYGYDATMWLYGKTVSVGADNALRPSPSFATVDSCTGFQPRYGPAQAYGRYGTGAFPAW
jgi:hypothetical protein